MEGAGDVNWEPGQQDPLALLLPLLLSADQPQSAQVAVKLEDAFGNPLIGRPVQIYSAETSPEQPAPDAGGAREDAGATDVAVADLGLADAAVDGGAPTDGGTADAGSAQLPSTAQAPTILLGSAAEGCRDPQPPETPGATVTDDAGSAIFCLQPGVERGDWAVYIEPQGLIENAFGHGEAAFQLNGQTVAGLPTQILALVDQEPLLCLPGRSTDTVRFRVANSEGKGSADPSGAGGFGRTGWCFASPRPHQRRW